MFWQFYSEWYVMFLRIKLFICSIVVIYCLEYINNRRRRITKLKGINFGKSYHFIFEICVATTNSSGGRGGVSSMLIYNYISGMPISKFFLSLLILWIVNICFD